MTIFVRTNGRMWVLLKQIAGVLCAFVAIIALGSCMASREITHLSSRPHAPSRSIEAGVNALRLGDNRDGFLYVPKSYRSDKPMPLIVMLHGGGGDAKRMLWLSSVAEDAGVIMLVPESRGRTWDAIKTKFGDDVDFLQRALEFTFDACLVDSTRIALGGFSDGASYALSLGLCNGGLFTHLIAFSPGFLLAPHREGNVRIYMSHGTRDQVLPIDSTSRVIAYLLIRWGYDVRFREFEGRHALPETVAREAFDWFVK